MTILREMIASHPHVRGAVNDELVRAAELAAACAAICRACADACLGEEMVSDLVQCIRLDLDCADLCAVTGRILSRQTAFDATLARAVLEACVAACKACGDECRHHGEIGDGTLPDLRRGMPSVRAGVP